MTHPSPKPSPAPPAIRVGVGGWTYEPWRNNFFPPGLPHSQELAWASRQLSAIEVNGTYYGTLKPASFKKWHDETPADFMFSLKASRYATNRRVLAEAGESIHRFLGSGISELGRKLGPIVWQFMPGKVFEAADFEAFLALLPSQVDGLPLRHVLDVRHESFSTPAYLALARRYGCMTVYTDASQFVQITDSQGQFAYLRLMRSQPGLPTGYPPGELDQWAAGARAWTGGSPPREVFIYFINGAKEKAPAAAMALLARLGFKAAAA